MANLNYVALLSAGVTLATGALQAKGIEENTALTESEKTTQLAALAAADVPKLLSALGVPAEIVALVADAKLDEQIIQAAEAAAALVKAFAPHQAA